MSLYVVDASVAAKWFIEEVDSNAAVRLLEDGHWLQAPDFLLIEIDSVISKRIRREELSEDHIIERDRCSSGHGFSHAENAAKSGALAPEVCSPDGLHARYKMRCSISEEEGRAVRSAFRQFPIQSHSFLPLLDPAYEIAIATGQKIYDCLYVALAAQLDAAMVTADRRLYDGLADGPFAKYLLWVEEIA